MEFMAWDLWGPSYNQAAQDSNCYVQPGWQHNFYFGFGVDVIEEDALNEEFCVQVLRILITKADAEIDELEKDLLTLQIELACAECEEWSEICCSTLREKIHYLDMSLKSLRNTEKCEIDVHLLMHREPAEGPHEIVEALLQNHPLKRDEQPSDVTAKDSSSEAPAPAGSGVIVKEEVRELIITSPEKSPVLCSLKIHEEKANSLEAVKPANTNVNDAVPDPLLLAAGHSVKKKKSCNSNSTNAKKKKAKSEGSTVKGKRIVQHSVLNPTLKPADSIVKRSSSDAVKCTVGMSKSNKKIRANDWQEVSKEVQDPRVDTIILDLSVKPEEGGTGLLKCANAVKDSAQDVPAHATSNSHEMRKLCNLDLEVDVDEEVRKPCFARMCGNLNTYLPCSDSNGYIPTTEMCRNAIKEPGTGSLGHETGNSHEMKTLCSSGLEVDGDKEDTEQYSETKKSPILSSSPCCSEGHVYFPNTETPAKAFVQCNDVHASRYAANHGRMEQGSESVPGAFKQSVSANPDVKLTLGDTSLGLRTSTEKGMEVCTTNKIDLVSSSETKGNINDTQKVPEIGMGNSEPCGLTSPSKQQYAPVQAQLTETADSDDKPQTQETKWKSELNMPSIQQANVLPTGTGGGSDSTVSKVKNRKSQLNMPSIQQANALPTGTGGGSDSTVSKVKKRKSQLSMPSIQQANALPIGTGGGSDSTVSKVKKRRKLEKNNDNVCLSKLLGRLTLKKPVQAIQEGQRELNVTANISINSIVQIEKETEKRSSLPILLECKGSTIDMDISDSLGEGTKRAGGEIPCPIDGGKGKASSATSCDLSEMKLVDLKAIARHYKLQQYSKLKKEQLVKQLTDALRF